MKVAQAKILHAENQLVAVDLIRNPSNIEQWFILVIHRDGQTFFLEEAGKPLIFKDITESIILLKEIGFKKAQIHL